MSTCIGEIIEVKINDKWELLKLYYNYEYDFRKGGLIDDYNVYNAKSINTNDETKLVCREMRYVDDYEFLNILLELMPNDLGLPDDVSDEAKRVYENQYNKPSIPSYFTLDELIKLYYNYRNDGYKDLENEIKEEHENLVLNKLDYICEKLDNPNIKRGYKGLKNETEANWRLLYTTLIEDITAMSRNIWRIEGVVDVACPTIYKSSDVRVIWFVV